jgi:methionyl-tRNA formyltransferase
MRLLLLSPYPDALAPVLAAAGDHVLQASGEVAAAALAEMAPDMIVSYGYRHLLGPDIVERYAPRILNLHVSFLPWNRGSDPNFWSFFDDTPKGVSIHEIDRGIDTGRVLVQQDLTFSPSETLASSYAALRTAIEHLFESAWSALRAGAIEARAQQGPGTSHRARDKDQFMARLPLGWQTPVAAVEALGRNHRAGQTLPQEADV